MKSKGRTLAIAVAICAIITLSMGAVTNWFRDWSQLGGVSQIAAFLNDGSSTSSGSVGSIASSSDGTVTVSSDNDFIKLKKDGPLSVNLDPFYESTVKVTATVASLTEKSVSWSLSWSDSSVTDSVTDYVKIVSQTDTSTGGYCSVTAIKPFKKIGKAKVTATNVDKKSASVEIRYLNAITYTCSEYNENNSTLKNGSCDWVKTDTNTSVPHTYSLKPGWHSINFYFDTADGCQTMPDLLEGCGMDVGTYGHYEAEEGSSRLHAFLDECLINPIWDTSSATNKDDEWVYFGIAPTGLLHYGWWLFAANIYLDSSVSFTSFKPLIDAGNFSYSLYSDQCPTLAKYTA